MSKIYIDENGYKRYKDSGKLVHRHVAEMMVGGKIREEDVVHHKDGNKLNNKRSNLRTMSRSAHSKLEARKRGRGR